MIQSTQKNKYSIQQLNKLWSGLGNIPINDNEEIELDFLHFPKGTDRYTIWHWFENQNLEFSVGKITNPE